MEQPLAIIYELFPKAYIVGGAVRDRLLNRPNRDYDIVIPHALRDAAAQLAQYLSGKVVDYDKTGRSMRVVWGESTDNNIDLSNIEGAFITEDLNKRDFTINALAIPILHWHDHGWEHYVIDPSGGLADHCQRRIRMVSHTNILADPIRAWRGARMAAELGFTVEPLTQATMGQTATAVPDIAPEKLRVELQKLFALPCSASGLKILLETGLLTALWPEIEAAQGMAQNEHHQYTVWEHSWRAYTNMEDILNTWRYFRQPELVDRLSHYIVDDKHLWLIKMASLLHDVGKPPTRRVSDDGRVHFYAHEKVGSELVAHMASKISVGSQSVRYLKAFIRYHMYPRQLYRASKSWDHYLFRYFSRTKPVGVWVLLFSLADALAKGDNISEGDDFKTYVKMVEAYLHTYFLNPEKINVEPLVDGDAVKKALGLKQGKMVGEVMEYLLEEQAWGKITTSEEALRAAACYLARQQK